MQENLQSGYALFLHFILAFVQAYSRRHIAKRSLQVPA